MEVLGGKVIVITGGSSGIGAACGIEFAKLGAKLVLTGRDRASLADVADQCLKHGAPQVHQVVADLCKEDDVKLIVKETMETFGTIHVLVNNAGGPTAADSAQTKLSSLTKITGCTADLDIQYKLSVRSPWQLCGMFVDELIKNKGSIVNISSVFAELTHPEFYAYSTMKAAMNYMSRCMATELGMQGVRVNCIMVGTTRTKALRNLGIPPNEQLQVQQNFVKLANVLEQKVMDPSDIAKSVVFLASDDASRITGVALPVDCGCLLASPAYDFAGAKTVFT